MQVENLPGPQPPGTWSTDLPRWQAGLLLLLILCAAAALRWTFAVGPAGSDDMRYVKAAAQLAAGQTKEQPDHACVRAVFIVWLALWIKCGAGLGELVFSDILLSLAILLMVYALAARWTSRRAALLAVLWLAFYPLELLCSGLVVPDHLGVLLALLSIRFADRAMTEHSSRTGLQLLLAGICAGLAVSAKELYAILPVVYGLWAVCTIRPLRLAMWKSVVFGAAGLAAFCLELPFFYWWTGDWTYRFSALSEVYTPDRAAQNLGLRELLFYPLQLLANPGVSGVFGWALLAAVAGAARRLNDRRLVIFFSVGLFLFMQYGSFSIQHYALLPQQWRYMLPMVVLLFIPLGQWTLEVWRARTVTRLSLIIVMIGMCCTGLLAANQRAAEGLYGEQAMHCLAVARQKHSAALDNLVLPDWLARATALDLREVIADSPIVELGDGLQADELAELLKPDRTLLAPGIMWRLKQHDDNYVNMSRQLECYAIAEPIEDWSSPLDRLASRIPLLQPLARKTVIGRTYQLTPDFPE